MTITAPTWWSWLPPTPRSPTGQLCPGRRVLDTLPAAGAYVVLVDGWACAYLERGGRRLLTFPAADDDTRWVGALADMVHRGRVRRLRVERIDDGSAESSPWADALRAVGFIDGYKGLSLGA